MICSAPIGFHSVTHCINRYEIVMQAGSDSGVVVGGGGGGDTQCFLNWVLMKNA